MKRTKKVVLLIVEGTSEEVLLYRRLRKRFSEHDINIEVFHGDVFVDYRPKAKSIKSRIGDIVTSFLKKRKFKKSDVLAVLHITDTDGCYINEDFVDINTELTSSLYYGETNILVPNLEQKSHIVDRNKMKGSNIRVMNTVTHIIGGTIPYQLYYFSIHLEHVLFNQMNPNADGKVREVESFLLELEESIEDYLQQFNSEVNLTYDEAYRSSWDYIEIDNRSLERGTNVSLMFEFIENKSNE